jgi:hypothetical protein
MQPQWRHKLVATPRGILVDGEPPSQRFLSGLSLRSLTHFVRAYELMGKMTDKDWETIAPHGPDDVPLSAKIAMQLALSNPGLLGKYDPSQPRDERGRWVAGNDTAVPVPLWFPAISSHNSNGDPSGSGNDALNDALPGQSRSFSSSHSSSENEDEAKCEEQYDRDITGCQMYAAMTGNKYTFVACKRQAERNFAQCMYEIRRNKNGP